MPGANSIQDASAKMEAFFFFWDKTSFSGKGKVEVIIHDSRTKRKNH